MQDPLNFSGPKGPAAQHLTDTPQNVSQHLTPPEVGPRLESKALPLEWLLNPRKRATLKSRDLPLDEVPAAVATERILARMIQQKAHEEDPWLETDRHIAWLTVKWAAEGVPEWSWYHRDPPFVAATGETLHCDPDKVWEHIVAERKYWLGWEYSKFYDENDNWIKESDLARREAKLGTTSSGEGFTGAREFKSEHNLAPCSAPKSVEYSPEVPKKPSGSVPLESKEEQA